MPEEQEPMLINTNIWNGQQVSIMDLVKEIQKYECVDDQLLVTTAFEGDRLYTVQGRLEDIQKAKKDNKLKVELGQTAVKIKFKVGAKK
jgi:hypothetical protein